MAEENGVMIKHQSVCMFMDKCGACFNRNRCISATSITTDVRKYFLKICGKRQQQTPAMAAGKALHEDRLKDWPTLESMGYSKFKKRLYLGEEITLQELSLCSLRWGIHGIIDKFTIQYTKAGVINIQVSDLKPFFSKKYYKQIAVYALCLSDPDCMIAYNTITPRSHKRKRVAVRLYPRRTDFKLNIQMEIYAYIYEKPYLFEWMRDSVMTPQAAGTTMAIIKAANTRKELHKYGIRYLDQFAPCKDCKQLESSCSLYTICQKVVYDPQHKTVQLYHGRKNLLVKSKPHLRR
jgi:hypothetical protein